MTRAPISLPSSTAARPTPPAAPSTASVSPRLQLRAVAQRMHGGAVDDGERRRAVEVEAAVGFDQLVGAAPPCARARRRSVT